MKNKFLFLAIALLSGSAASADATYRCFPPRNNPDALMTDGYALVSLANESLRFRQFETFSGRAVLLRDYVYAYKGLAAGTGRTKGMMKFELAREVRSHGDSIGVLYAQTSLANGGNGALMFTGHGYSWDWNFCKLQD